MATATKRHPAQDETTERWLDDRMVEKTFVPDVPISQVDHESGLRNQARLGKPLNEETVERYVEFMRNGVILPAGVYAPGRSNGGRLVAVDANHRTEAHIRLNRDTIHTYQIAASPSTIVDLTFEANTRH